MDDQGVSQAEAMLLADLKHSDEVHSATNRIEKSRDMLQKCVQQQPPYVSCLSHPSARVFAGTATFFARNPLRRSSTRLCE